MRRSIKAGIAVVVVAGIVTYFVVAVIHDEHERSLRTSTLKNLKEVALALTLYATDHHGSLPASLDELLPTYTSEEFMRDHPVFLTPAANMDKLSNDTIILRAPDGTGRVAEVRADSSGAMRQP
jgi:hypothetical protein